MVPFKTLTRLCPTQVESLQQQLGKSRSSAQFNRDAATTIRKHLAAVTAKHAQEVQRLQGELERSGADLVAAQAAQVDPLLFGLIELLSFWISTLDLPL